MALKTTLKTFTAAVVLVLLAACASEHRDGAMANRAGCPMMKGKDMPMKDMPMKDMAMKDRPMKGKEMAGDKAHQMDGCAMMPKKDAAGGAADHDAHHPPR